jgi:HAD superfamily hydrolase (TIGR01549 family)
MTEPRFRAVLFDWRGTLFHDESDADWLRASAASIGRSLDEADAARLARAIGESERHPDVVAALTTSDCSRELNAAAVLLQLRIAGFDDELAHAVWRRDGTVEASMPFPDTPSALRALKADGVRVGVVSDIHYDLRPTFDHYGLLEYVDAFTLSFEHGCQKPDRRIFELALDALGATATETLMVGDRASRDGAAIDVGITTLLLPSPARGFEPRGLDVVLRLMD